jgi:hypothetical protein
MVKWQLFLGFARTTAQQRKPWHACFVSAKDQDMREFRDAKSMAGTLPAALAANGLKIAVRQSLLLIARAFGVAHLNTLSAHGSREGRLLGAMNFPGLRLCAT